ncbi:hypothetical protein A5719_10720 [Mycolicibacterium peregrinum]|nr:hypothetical protein A5719_10720 [Mycolicibacterium peregrinum]
MSDDARYQQRGDATNGPRATTPVLPYGKHKQQSEYRWAEVAHRPQDFFLIEHRGTTRQR